MSTKPNLTITIVTMKKLIIPFFLGLLISTLGLTAYNAIAPDHNAVGGSMGTIRQLSQWSNDGVNITQNVANTALKFTGLESSGDCLVTDASGVVTTDDCGSGGISDGDKGDITVSSSGNTWTIDNVAVTLAKLSSAVQTSLGLADSSSQATGVENNADVTDAANVSAAGAAMLGSANTFTNTGDTSFAGNVGIGTAAPDTKLQVAGAITQQPLSSDPADPDPGNSVQWVSDGTETGDAGDVMMKINVGGTTKVITLIDYSVA